MTEQTTGQTSRLFDPAHVQWQRVDFKLAYVRLAGLYIIALPLLVLGGFGAQEFEQTWLWIVWSTMLLLTVWLTVLIPRQVRAIAYAERVDDLLIRRGIMFRRMSIVPYGRMQFVDVNAGPIARKFAIATVQLHTAAAASEAVIPGLPEVEAHRLRDTLASRGQARMAGL